MKKDKEYTGAGQRKIKNKSRWRYMGPNWGWATLFFIFVDVLIVVGERKGIIHLDPSYWVATTVVFLLPIFCYFMWVGAGEFFSNHSGG
jgi:hypothetical protein